MLAAYPRNGTRISQDIAVDIQRRDAVPRATQGEYQMVEPIFGPQAGLPARMHMTYYKKECAANTVSRPPLIPSVR
ncbi:hypothetical protein, partial [Paraburkholderia oxyphila]|uniref:hypothetical protein n=1 Tax=Paraburkholderia oxyphila TaxID=614212 RepID=UPI001C3F31AF